MKFLINLLITFIFFTDISFSQEIPQLIFYQGNLTDAAGLPIDNSSFEMTFSIWSSKTGGSKLWEENYESVTIHKSLFNILLGSNEPLTLEVFSSAERYLQIEIAGETLAPRQQICSIPYAYNAMSSEALQGYSVKEQAPVNGQVLKWNDNAWTPGTDNDGGAPSGAAGGDLTGSYPNPTIADNSVTSSKILDGTITSADIGSNAVSSDEIAADAVGSSEIAANAVGSSEIATGAVRSDEIANNSVQVTDILDEPGVEYYETATSIDIPTTSSRISRISVSAPTPGYVLVIANGYINWNIATASQGMVRLKVSDISGSTTEGVGDQFFRFQSGLGTGRNYFPFCITRLFAVSAGTKEFYLNGWYQVQNGDAIIPKHTLTGIFIRTIY